MSSDELTYEEIYENGYVCGDCVYYCYSSSYGPSSCSYECSYFSEWDGSSLCACLAYSEK